VSWDVLDMMRNSIAWGSRLWFNSQSVRGLQGVIERGPAPSASKLSACDPRASALIQTMERVELNMSVCMRVTDANRRVAAESVADDRPREQDGVSDPGLREPGLIHWGAVVGWLVGEWSFGVGSGRLEITLGGLVVL